ncbi:LLM class flavin-dependent oxidoreductase [Rhodococcus sp. 06-621-2]|nr:NtaA/DmoA family FMN-dependent monooxygenase [Rhodococcus sp. 06-621-2]OZC55524.1 LLM class flavin-dependent oxidoreductase [Rhodococcus sp. 06-621-2]
MKKPLRLSAFVMNTTSHVTHGAWRLPESELHNYNSLDHWVKLGRRLEDGIFDFIFFADVVGLWDEFQGSWKKFADSGVHIPSNDPSMIASAIAYGTEHLGIALTSSIMQDHPFNFARRMSTLDHASHGRIAWNIVTSAAVNPSKNFGLPGLTPHDERYRWADEYVEVVYKLWEGSWDEGALLQDKKSGIHADYNKIHKIHHNGPRYRVEGPHLSAPSPQRTPFLFQAGSSPVGRRFAARNAEGQFLLSGSPEAAGKLIDDTRRLLGEVGRAPEDLTFYQGLSFVIGSTEEEALRKEQELEDILEIDTLVAHFGGSIGLDLGDYDLDDPVGKIETQGTKSLVQWVEESVEGRTATIADLGRLHGKMTRIVGTPDRIADELDRWRDAGVGGINVQHATIPGSYDEFIDHVIPVLQQRGLARRSYSEGSVRRKLTGSDRLPDSHPAARFRGAFANS